MPQKAAPPGLKFTLTCIRVPDNPDRFMMCGGPLDRVFTLAEWVGMVAVHPEENQLWYRAWAREASNRPNQPIPRYLK